METLRTLPGDDVRQIMWRFTDRYELQMAVQSARTIARGVVARLVADGARNTHEWTDQKAELLRAFDDSGLTALFMDPCHGGYIEGPKNLALSLVAFELAWVDGGAATCSLAGNLALAPIHEKGTPEQRDKYMPQCVPPQPGEDRTIWRGAFALTEALPYVGVDTGVLGGKVKVVEWEDGKEPVLQVDKRGRFITNMDFANFVTAAVDTADERIKSSCMVILEEEDPGVYDRGAPTQKMVHQLSSTRDPVFSLKIPASRIIGGYTIEDGVIVPNFTHGEIIGAVFHRTRIPVGLMTSAKLLSAVEPIIRYQRSRFRGGDASSPGTPRFELGLQQKEDALHRLIDVWSVGEAGASMGFEASRLADDFDPIERAKDDYFKAQDIAGLRKQMMALRKVQPKATEYIELLGQPEEERDTARLAELEGDTLVKYSVLDALCNVLIPATKLWNTGYGATMMREAVSLMGGYGITEDCPGFLGQKWMDAQLEATYEGPEAVQRRHLSVTMTNEVFLAQFRQWIKDMKRTGAAWPETGACCLGTAMRLWLHTLERLKKAKDANGKPVLHGKRQGATFPLADALCWLLASRSLIEDVLELKRKGPESPVLAEGLEGLLSFYADLCHVQAAKAAGEAGRICAELMFGYDSHPAWTDEGKNACYDENELEALEGLVKGIASCADSYGDVKSADGSNPAKAGPCARLEGMAEYAALRLKMDGCLTGSRLAKDRAAQALTQVMIPEALDYPI